MPGEYAHHTHAYPRTLGPMWTVALHWEAESWAIFFFFGYFGAFPFCFLTFELTLSKT